MSTQVLSNGKYSLGPGSARGEIGQFDACKSGDLRTRESQGLEHCRHGDEPAQSKQDRTELGNKNIK